MTHDGQTDLFPSPDELEGKLEWGRMSRDTRDVLFLMAAQSDAVSMSSVAEAFSRMGLKTEAGPRFTGVVVKAALQQLESSGWLRKQNQGRILVEGLRTKIFHAAFGDPDYVSRATTMAEWVLTGQYRGSYYRSDLARQIEMELLCYLGNDEGAMSLLEPEARYTRPFDGSLSFLLVNFDPAVLEGFFEPIRVRAVFDFLSDASFILASPDPAWAVLEKIGGGSARLTATAGTIHFLCGEETKVRDTVERLRSIAGKEKDPHGKRLFLADARALEACLDFAKGKIPEAIDGFEESISIEKGKSRKMKFCPRWIGGIVFQLALCRRGDAKDLRRAQQIGKWMMELYPTGFSLYGAFGEATADCLAGNTKDVLANARYHHPEFLPADPPNLNSLLFAIFYRLSGAEDDHVEAWGRRISELADLASERGYRWLAMEAAAFVVSVFDTAEHRDRAEQFAAKSGIDGAVAFSGEFVPPEPWEARLKAMEAVAQKYGKKSGGPPGPKKKAAARKELFWHLRIYSGEKARRRVGVFDPFDFDDDDDDDWDDDYAFTGYGESPDGYIDFDLVPVERSVSKTGKVTKGRKVSLKRLKESPDAFVSLTDQDKAVAKFICKQRHWGGRGEFSLENPRCLVELAGHPLVFADADASQPVTLIRERIRVEVSDDGESKVAVRLVPTVSTGEKNVKLVEDGPDCYRVYEIPKAVSELAKAFEGKDTLKLPANVKGRLMNAVSTLASDLEIGAEGEIGDAEGETDFRKIEGDPTPRLRLVPESGGLRAKLHVQPIATSDFVFSPGEGKAAIFGFDKNDRIQAVRDLEKEKALADDVVEACPTLSGQRGGLPDPWEWLFESPQESLELLRDLHLFREGKSEPSVVLEWPEGEGIKFSGVVSAANTTVALGGSTDWLSVSGEVAVDEELVFSLRKLLQLSTVSDRPGFVEIGEGRFIALTEEFQRQIDDLRALSQPGKGESIKLPPLGALALENFVDEAKAAPGRKKAQAKLWKEWIDRFREARRHSPDPPAGLRADLRPYQLDGYRWLSRLAKSGAGACLADDMGLGKTVQALALLLERAENGPSLVVAPTSVVANWLDETMKFAPTLNPVVLGGAAERSAQLAELGPRDLVFSTYGVLPREADALADIEWNVIVLDEAQAIKNSATQRSKAARKLRGGFRLVTTGTPVENRLSELHTLFQFVLPGFLGSWDRFRKQFADPIERDRDPAARDHLRRLIQPFLLRRLKSNVLRDLPEKTEINLHVELGEEEMAFYEALRQRAVEELEGGDETGAIQILAELTRLRRACCHPSLVDPEVGTALGGAKLAAFSETLDELLAGGHKVLVFSQFVDHLSLIRAELERKEICYQYLDGSTSKPKRKQAVDAFQRGEGDVFLISLKAGGFGLNLTAADYVIHMDPWWNPAAEDQASDRAHRIGQTRPVTIYRFVTRNTIEEKIVDLHHRKRELADSLLSDSADADTRLSPEQLLDLIRE